MNVMAVRHTRLHGAVFCVAAIVSLLLSYWISLHETVINPDAICYLQSADTFGTAGFHAALHLCDQSSWPFYSLLIFSLSHLSPFSTLNAAFALDAVFSLLTVLSFIYVVYLLGGSRRVLWFAAAVILLAHEFNSVRHYIIRDHGFWAFYLLAMVFLIHHCRAPRFRTAIAWSAAAIVATLFRVEGAVFVLFMPVISLFVANRTLKQRLVSYLQLNMLTLILGFVFFIGVTYFAVHGSDSLQRLSEVTYQLTHGLGILSTHFHNAADALAIRVLGPYGTHDAPVILGITLFIWYVMNVVTNLSVIATALVIYAMTKSLLRFDSAARWVVWGTVAVNVAVTAVFLIENMFVSQRYLIALSLVLLLWVPFALDSLYQWKSRRWVLPVVILLMALTSVSSVVSFGYSKEYLREAGEWLSMHVPDDTTLYSNDEQVLYYSNHYGNAIFERARDYSDLSIISQERWKQYHYLAIRTSSDDTKDNDIIKEITTAPVTEFANKRGDKVVIYQIEN